MAEIDLSFRITETIRYIGHVTVDQDHLNDWMKTKGHAELTGDILHDYVSDMQIDVEETDDDVQGQEWDRVRPHEGQDDSEVTVPLETSKAA
jgi:hypothetical protein